jgi:hypothetical protein
MSDVLQTAQKYRNRLKAEIAKVDDFLHIAETLLMAAASGAGTLDLDAAAKAPSPEPRAEERPRTSLGAAAAVTPEADRSPAAPVPATKVRASLFRGSFEPIESEPGRNVA